MPIHFKDRNTTDQALADAGLGPTVDASIQLEEDMNAFRPRISLDHEIAVWKTYGDDGPEAARRLLTTIKEIKSPALRQKAVAPGMVSVQMTREEADAWQAAIANEGNKRIVALLRQVAGQQVAVSAGGTLTDSGNQSKPTTKTTKTDPLIAAIQSGGNWDGR